MDAVDGGGMGVGMVPPPFGPDHPDCPRDARGFTPFDPEYDNGKVNHHLAAIPSFTEWVKKNMPGFTLDSSKVPGEKEVEHGRNDGRVEGVVLPQGQEESPAAKEG